MTAVLLCVFGALALIQAYRDLRILLRGKHD